MFLASYDFAGPSEALVAGYHRMLELLGGADVVELNLCVVTETGITVYDGCPTRADFEAFSQGEELASAIARAGLPTPTVTPIGEVHSALVAQGVHA